jgi:trk system potassium uptake protein TrkA
MLSNDGHNVVVIDANSRSFRRLGAGFNGITVVGNGFDEQILEKAGIKKADVFVAVTNLDNANIMAGQVAKKLYDVPKVVSRVYYPDREKTYHKLGLETVCGTTLVARKIRDWVLGRGIVSEVNLDHDSQIAEITASPQLVGKRVADIEIPNQFRPMVITRDEKSIIVSADTQIVAGDTIIAAIHADAVEKVRNLFGVEVNAKARSGLSCPVPS